MGDAMNDPQAPLALAERLPQWSADQSPTLTRVMAGELCAGCGLCAGIVPAKIAMQLTPAGFARPFAVGGALSEAEDARVAQTCPGQVIAPWDDSAAQVHPSWGPIRQCSEGHATDASVRFGGSSGGLLSALAIHALEAGLVDAVVHLAADPDVATLNRLTISTSRQDVMAAAGSRYGPSPVLSGMEALLSDPRRFMIIGKPCDISALRQLAKVDPRVSQRFLWMLSFFCGGMPSIKGTEAIIDTMGLAKVPLARFRYRGNGWPGSARAEAVDGRVGEMSYADSWGRYLSGRVQYRCKICPDAVGGSADIAAADAWYGGETGYPQFDERDGRSLILVRSAAGGELLASAVGAAACVAQPLAISQIDLMQPSQAQRKRLIVARTLAARMLLQPVPTMRGLQVTAAARTAGLREQARNFLGSVRRIVQGRR
jgi:coenzyme F420 hydrogenase subunit beta